jgi:voltage-gated potassium channel
VLAITVLVIVVGAAGMLFFEAGAASPPAGGAALIDSYGEALWWTATTMTTVGSEYAPITAEGRLLGWLLSLYALGVFGYVTATIASHFLRLGPVSGARTASDDRELASLRAEIAALREAVLGQQGGAGG